MEWIASRTGPAWPSVTPTNASSDSFDYNIMSPIARSGYRFVASDGGVFNYGTGAPFLGSLGGTHLNAPVVGIGVMPAGDGYYLVASDGGVFAYGSAQFYGSMGGKPLNKPIVGMAVTPDGGGYWLVASDGGVFAFGDAQLLRLRRQPPAEQAGGRASRRHPTGSATGSSPPTAASSTTAPPPPSWARRAASRSTSRSSASAPRRRASTTSSPRTAASSPSPTGPSGPPFYGSTSCIKLNKPIVGMTVVQGGYYLSGSDGGIFAFPTGTGRLAVLRLDRRHEVSTLRSWAWRANSLSRRPLRVHRRSQRRTMVRHGGS